MNEKLKKIHEYLIGKGAKEEDLLKSDTSSVYLAMEIAEYAHRNQIRENGEDYVSHPYRVLEGYSKLTYKISEGFIRNGEVIKTYDLKFPFSQSL